MSAMNRSLFGAIRVARTDRQLTVSNDLFTVHFDASTGGFPTHIGYAGEAPLLDAGAPVFSAAIAGRGRIHPALGAFAPEIVREEDGVRVLFDRIGWVDAKGEPVEGFRTALEYEFFPDGTAFVKTFFYTETTEPPLVTDLTLAPTVRLPADCEANWAYWTFPKQITAKIIQDMGTFERNLTRRDARTFEGTLPPFFSIDFGSRKRRDRHIEFFLESLNSLCGEHTNTAADIAWKGRQAAIRWNFQREALRVERRAYAWRNVWGWCLRRFPVRRNRAPLRICHYLDNFKRYPTAEIIRRVAAQGADTLILHENWRLDMAAGEMPYDLKRLKAVARDCRRHGLRLGLYVRGNEHGIRERLGEPLRPFLRRNRDGIYMDFGSPMCFLAAEEEAPGGRIHFREYHRMTRAIRRFVGPEGFFISHSGSFFAAMAHTEVDTYLGGEQEKGMLLKNSTVHGYFSGLSIVPGALWTAAFPTYRTPAMTPFLATAFQTPFLHLGVQATTCSLAHPEIPSTITFARPLWRLWELFDGERDLRAFSTAGGPDALRGDSDATGASLMLTRRGDALLVLANYSARARRASVGVDWRAVGAKAPAGGWRLAPTSEQTCAEALVRKASFSAELPPHGLVGWLLTDALARWRKRIERFLRPYPGEPEAEARWRAEIESTRRRRYEPARWHEAHLRVAVPNFPNNYEHSLWFDLFDNIVELHRVEGGKCRLLGYVTRNGLAQEPAERAQYLYPDEPSPWIPLHTVLGPGRHELVLASRRQGGEFYSFVKAELSPRPGRTPETRELIYSNEIDMDWSRLGFTIDVTPSVPHGGRARPLSEKEESR